MIEAMTGVSLMDEWPEKSGESQKVAEYVRMLEAGLRERARQAALERREGEELVRRAETIERWVAAQGSILEQLKVELGIADDETGISMNSPTGDEAESVAVASPVYERGSTIRQVLGPDWEYVTPDKDPQTHEPIYDEGVVSGLRNGRERALAAARVYGPRLREGALADAIFRTGETRAASAASVRGSLGGVVRYGGDWRRERGVLIYQGEALEPDWETIRRLSQARQEQLQQGRQEEDCARIDSV